MELNRNLAHRKVSSSINHLSINHLTCHVAIFLKIANIWRIADGFKRKTFFWCWELETAWVHWKLTRYAKLKNNAQFATIFYFQWHLKTSLRQLYVKERAKREQVWTLYSVNKSYFTSESLPFYSLFTLSLMLWVKVFVGLKIFVPV